MHVITTVPVRTGAALAAPTSAHSCGMSPAGLLAMLFYFAGIRGTASPIAVMSFILRRRFEQTPRTAALLAVPSSVDVTTDTGNEEAWRSLATWAWLRNGPWQLDEPLTEDDERLIEEATRLLVVMYPASHYREFLAEKLGTIFHASSAPMKRARTAPPSGLQLRRGSRQRRRS